MKPAHIFGLAFFTILVLLLYQIALIFTPFLVPVLWAVMLTRIAYPLYRRVHQLLNGRASLAAALVTSGIMLLGVLPVVFVFLLYSKASWRIWRQARGLGTGAQTSAAVLGGVARGRGRDSGADRPVYRRRGGHRGIYCPRGPGHGRVRLDEAVRVCVKCRCICDGFLHHALHTVFSPS